MIYRLDKNFNRRISLLGYGTWGLGSDSYGNISEKRSLTLLNHSIKNVINFIDTSNIYGRGLSEKRIGLLLLTLSLPLLIAQLA
jgi:aryl-alcohol dehydrogenase-like predicted oxidoreductase